MAITDGHRAEVLDGKQLAGRIKADLAERVATLRLSGRRPGLGTILVGDDPASRSYVEGKHRDCSEVGLASIRIELAADCAEADVLAAVRELNAADDCTGFIVQLPVPKNVSTPTVLAAIDPSKDADGLHPANLGRLVLNEPAPLPCTPRGILTLLREYQIPIRGADICVIGCGVTVGRPLGLMLTSPSVHATATLCHEATVDIATHAASADVLIAAAGAAHLVKAEWVKPGATVISVGLSRTVEGILGDVDPRVEEVAGRWTRAIGGVGPMTRAMLLTNVVETAERSVV